MRGADHPGRAQSRPAAPIMMNFLNFTCGSPRVRPLESLTLSTSAHAVCVKARRRRSLKNLLLRLSLWVIESSLRIIVAIPHQCAEARGSWGSSEDLVERLRIVLGVAKGFLEGLRRDARLEGWEAFHIEVVVVPH